MSDKIIEACELSKRFANITAVNSISFDVKRGSVCALLGGNGAGKTTTIAMLLGLISPTDGEVWMFGEPFDRLPSSFSLQHRGDCSGGWW